jgi:DNA-binding transcriptional regulator of glucitol operon
METPGSTPPAEGEAVPWVMGQIVPKAPGPDRSESDIPEAEGTSQPPSGPVWHFLFKPRWLLWHLVVVLAFCGMLWLCDWQYHRALGGNGLSWAYVFEWPLFAGFAVVFWARTIRDEFILRRGGVTEAQLVERAAYARAMATLPAGAMLPAGELPEGFSIRQVEQPLDSDADDPELASYNAYLAKLNAKDRKKALGASAAARKKALGAG